jgi:hypothetical protein
MRFSEVVIGSAPELAPSSVERDSTAQVGVMLAGRLSNTESGLPRERAPVAEFGTRFVTRCGTVATQVPEEEENREWRRGWDFEPTEATT